MSIPAAAQRVIDDPLQFIPRLKIIDKSGKLIKLSPNDEQLKVLSSLGNDDLDTLVLKARQLGISTIVSAYLFWKWYSSKDPINVVILSHKLDSIKEIFQMFKRFYQHLPKFLKRSLSVDNTTILQLADTGAKVMAMSAKGDGGLRSFSAHYLLISEYAFADDPEELKATALAALNGNKLIIESTANFYNDALHKEVIKAQQGEAGWDMLFFPWHEHVEYRSKKIPEDFETNHIEKDLQIIYGLNDHQLHWRRMQIQKFGEDKFTREYPACIEDAYAQGDGSYFSPSDLANLQVLNVKEGSDSLVFIKEPEHYMNYGIGVDVAEGVGRDYSVIKVMDKLTFELVATWRSNKVSPKILSDKILFLGRKYNNAKVLVEKNNIGHAVLVYLRNAGYTNLWKSSEDKDWDTNVKTKPLMFSDLKDAIRTGSLKMVDQFTYQQLRSYSVNDRGIIFYPKSMEGHGDDVVALALAIQCLGKVLIPKRIDYFETAMKARAKKEMMESAGRSSLRRY